MPITTENGKALIDTKLGVPKGAKTGNKKKSDKRGKYPQQTRPIRRPKRTR